MLSKAAAKSVKKNKNKKRCFLTLLKILTLFNWKFFEGFIASA